MLVQQRNAIPVQRAPEFPFQRHNPGIDHARLLLHQGNQQQGRLAPGRGREIGRPAVEQAGADERELGPLELGGLQ